MINVTVVYTYQWASITDDHTYQWANGTADDTYQWTNAGVLNLGPLTHE